LSSTRDESSETAAPAPTPSDAERLRKESEELRLVLGRAAARIQKLEAALAHAHAQVAWFQRQLFGQKAERVASDDLEKAWLAFIKEQEAEASGAPKTERRPMESELASLQLLLGFVAPALVQEGTAIARAETHAEPTDAGAAADETCAPSAPAAPPKKKGHGRNRVPTTLREESITLEPDPDEIPEGARRVSAEVSYRIGIRPAELVRIAVIRPRYAVDGEEESTSFVSAEPPHEMIPRGLFAPSGLAHIIASKWDRHVPYNRLGRFFAAEGYRLSTSTLSGVVIRAAPLAKLLVEAMELYARSVAPYLAIDATGALLQAPEACLRGHTWMRYIEDVCVLVSFTKTHDSESAGAQLDGWTCPTLADGASVYDRKHRETGNPRGGCWSHGRRNLVYAAATDGRALVGIKFINDLFEIEHDLIALSPEARLAVRTERSAPIVRELFAWRDELLTTANLGRSLLAKALRYLRNQADRLTYFLRDGRIPIHNNNTELQARHFAVGRKNWLFYGSEDGADAGSTWLSLVLSARMHDLPPEQYLRDLFRVLPAWPSHRLLELAPLRWKDTRRRLNPLELTQELGPITIPPPPPL
jgi:transposase